MTPATSAPWSLAGVARIHISRWSAQIINGKAR